MTLEEFTNEYYRLQTKETCMVDRLYMFHCLRCSGFEDVIAYELIDTLNDVWLKDETDTGLSRLSDYLYELYDEGYDIKNMPSREIIQTIDWSVF